MDLHVTLAVLSFMEWVWEGRDEVGVLDEGELVARIRLRAVAPFLSILSLIHI